MKRNYILIPIGGGGKKIELSPLTVTENGVYTAGEDKGYNEVSVSVADIPAVTEPLNITENGVYTPSSGVDGFSEVSVNVPDIPAVTEPLNVTENGTYSVPEGVDGYNTVSVNVPTTDVQNLTINQNGSYTAPEGVSYGNIEVSVPAVDVSVVSSVVSAAPVSFTALDVVIKVGSNKAMTSYGVDYSTDNFQTYQSVSNSGTYFGEKTITITGLNSGTTYQVRSFVVVDGVRYDQEPFNTIATASIPVYPESVPAKATMMTTTDLSSSKTVRIGYSSIDMPDENFYVDWGDGSEIQLYGANTNTGVYHTYTTTGKKTIYCWSDSTTDTEYGKMPGFSNDNYISQSTWTEIETIETPLQKIYGGSTHYTANGTVKDKMFAGAKQLKFVCSDLFENYCDPTQPLANYCYRYMFFNCTSLTTAPELPATTLAQQCYIYMFSGCASLTTAPELPATTLATNCYGYMFDNCTSLTTAPELPATTLADYCYSYMFRDCTSLTTAPELPATTLSTQCYQYMFYDCTSLTTAPELPATTLASYCYSYMFYNCTNLQSVTTRCVNWNTSYTYGWLSGAGTNAENPTLYCPANSTIKTYTGDDSGIPTGWTQVDLTE